MSTMRLLTCAGTVRATHVNLLPSSCSQYTLGVFKRISTTPRVKRYKGPGKYISFPLSVGMHLAVKRSIVSLVR